MCTCGGKWAGHNCPYLHYVKSAPFLPPYILSLPVPPRRVWTSTVKQIAAHSIGERKRVAKKKEEERTTSPPPHWQHIEEQLQAELAIALRREGLALFTSETTNT